MICVFGPNLPKKGGGGTKFQLKLNFFFFGPKLPKLSKVFPVEHAKIALARAPMVAIYYIKFFGTGADRHNGILMSLLHLIAATVRSFIYCFLN